METGAYQYGDKLPSENELAIRFGVSRQTVRQAVGVLESEGLVRRVRGSGTFVADPQKLPRQPTGNIGVIATYLDEYIFPSLLRGVESVLAKERYAMSLGVTHNRLENEARALTNINVTGFDGLIVEGTKTACPNPNLPFYESLARQGVPLVFVNGGYPIPQALFVGMDDVAAGELACNTLLKYGHKKIAGILKSDDIQGRQRYAGFSRAMEKAGCPVEEDAVFWYDTESYDHLFGGNADNALLKRLRGFTAVICYNDQTAVRFLAMLKRLGLRAPKDLSIVSFDNSSLAKKSLFNLASVVYPGRQIGEEAARLLVEWLRSGKPGESIKIPPVIKLRGSIKKLEKA